MNMRGLALLFDTETTGCMLKRIEAARKRSMSQEQPDPSEKHPIIKPPRYGRRAKVLSILYGYRRVPMR